MTTTPVLAKRGKNYRQALQRVDRAQTYTLQEAVALAKQAAYAKFNETVELHVSTGCDPRQANQQVRGTVVLPHGLGKQMRVLVFTQGEAVRAAQEAGADHVGADDLVKQIQGGWVDFDVAIATPDMMSKIGRLGPILGRRGLMPNPRSGTVVQPNDVAQAVAEAKKGRVEYKLDRTGVIHVAIGKINFEQQQLVDNLVAMVTAINRARPSGIKGTFLKNFTLKTTMGPGIKINLASILTLKAV